MRTLCQVHNLVFFLYLFRALSVSEPLQQEMCHHQHQENKPCNEDDKPRRQFR